MAQNNNYSFNLFDTIDYGGTSAPKFEPEYEPYKAPSRKKANVKKAAPEKTRAKVKKTAAMTKAQAEQAAFNRIVFAIGATVAVVFFVLVAGMLAISGQIDANTEKIAVVDTNINEGISERTRLQAELDAKVSIDKIDDYALNVLGMIKLEDYKINYIGAEEENHVVISGGKTYGNAVTAKFLQLKEYFAD